MLFTTSLTIESWVLYGLGVAIFTCRLASRRIKLGKWSALQVDDYLMMFALTNFTGVVVSINEVAKNGSNYLPPDVARDLSPTKRAMAIYGSKMTFVLEIFSLTGLWTVKACLLLLYARLTKSVLTVQHVVVKFAAVYCIGSYLLVMLMFIFFWCHPIYQYWAVPVQIMQCATYYHHMIFATAFNISSDLLLFFIPIPIIIKTRLPLKRKIIICCILGLGVFNILAAILNRYYNFSNPNSYVFLYWYVAEMGISMFVGNLPLCWPILRLAFCMNDTSSAPSGKYQERSGDSRKRFHGSSVLSTKGTFWDKLDDQEDSAVGEERQAGSDNGSQIELALHGQNLHTVAVSCDGKRDAVEPTAMATATATATASANEANPSANWNGDRIMVTTTVDVSLEAH